MRLALLASPRAGRGGRAGARVRAAFTGLGHEVADVTGAGAADAARHAAALVRDGVDALVAVGGDGTVHLAAGALAGTGVPLAVVPAGSGDDTARALGLLGPRRGGELGAVERVHAALTAPGGVRAGAVDLVAVEPDGGPVVRCVSVVAAGLDAAVTARAAAWAERAGRDGRAAPDGRRGGPRLPGRARYTGAVLRELPAWRPRHYRLELDGRVVEREAVLVAVASTSTYGGGMRIAPGAVPDDGLLDVVVVGALSRAALLALLPTVFHGAHVRHPAVAVHRAARVRVEDLGATGGRAGPAPPLLASGDGEPLGRLPLVCRVEHRALRVVGLEARDPAS